MRMRTKSAVYEVVAYKIVCMQDGMHAGKMVCTQDR